MGIVITKGGATMDKVQLSNEIEIAYRDVGKAFPSY